MPKITALETAYVRHLQNGGEDANGQPAERVIAQGKGNPCRHCLRFIPEGEEMLVLALRPFPALQPYAETGPIFLCAKSCDRHEGNDIPEILRDSPDYLIKGYGADNRIVYGTGVVIPAETMMQQAETIFADERVSYIHIRSARNNCYQARIDHA